MTGLICWLGLRPEQFEALRAKGVDDGETTLEFEELKPDRSSGDRFTASIEALETIIRAVPAAIGKRAGDALDELAQKRAAKDGISYTAAFRRASAAPPELYRLYREQAT